jgi:hypothetical protein
LEVAVQQAQEAQVAVEALRVITLFLMLQVQACLPGALLRQAVVVEVQIEQDHMHNLAVLAVAVLRQQY